MYWVSLLCYSVVYADCIQTVYIFPFHTCSTVWSSVDLYWPTIEVKIRVNSQTVRGFYNLAYVGHLLGQCIVKRPLFKGQLFSKKPFIWTSFFKILTCRIIGLYIGCFWHIMAQYWLGINSALCCCPSCVYTGTLVEHQAHIVPTAEHMEHFFKLLL